MRSLDIAGTGMQAQQTNVEVISNNIANMTTTGFKRRRAEFEDLLYQNLRRVGSQHVRQRHGRAAGAQVGLGVQDGRRSTASTSRATCSRRATAWTWRSRATATSR